MKSPILSRSARCATILAAVVWTAPERSVAADRIATQPPVHELRGRGVVREWLVLGPFPNNEVDDPLPDGTLHAGHSTDFLTSIGGESGATVSLDTRVQFLDERQVKHEALTRSVVGDEQGVVDLNALFAAADWKVAYAFTQVRTDRAQTVGFLFGSDDGARVWINGKLVHDLNVGRGLTPGEDSFSAQLEPGLNTILVKVTDFVRDWAFVLEALDADSYAALLEHQATERRHKEFLDCVIVPQVGNPWDQLFVPGAFPLLGWDKPLLVEKVMGKFPLTTRWFDSEYNEVTRAEHPGRYGYVVEGVAPGGQQVRRGGTMFCRPHDWLGWSERPRVDLNLMHANFIDRKAWEEHREAIAHFAGREIVLSILGRPEGAILMSYLYEMKATGRPASPVDTPLIRDHEYHLGLKRRLLGLKDKWPPLQMPRRKAAPPAAVLRAGTPAEAGVSPGTADRLRAVCEAWYAGSGEPFVVLVARRGVIVIHEAFGRGPTGPVTRETQLPMASLTKLLTGVLFAQFVDQGLIGIDDPVGKYLPDFPTEGNKVITLRQCFTHTTGLWGHAEWGGMHNPYLENVIANGLGLLRPGEVHHYNGMGYDLAGKVMEIVSGKSVFRLMRENFLDPLGLDHTVLEEDLGFSCNSTALDYGTIGQLLLNKGSYGDRTFFSPATWGQLMPVQLNRFYPSIREEWGIGITWMRQAHPDAGRNGLATDATILSRNMYAHGAATSAVLRIDPDNDLVIAQTRRIAGKKYDVYLTQLLQAIENGLVE